MKPYVICHMVASLDGRTLISRWQPEDARRRDLLEPFHDQLEADAWLIGRVTGRTFPPVRAMTSSAFSLGCVLPDGAFRLLQGQPKGVQRTTGSGRVSTRWVCPECGVWVCTAPRPGSTVRNVRGGTLDDTSWLRPTAHIWTRSKQSWLPLPEGDRNFETQPQGDPWWASVAPTG